MLRRYLSVILVLLSWPIFAASAVAASKPAVAIVDCGSAARVRPTTLIIACADANLYVSSITWSNWGGARASARGVLRWNDCTPTCVAGHWHRRAVNFKATTIKSRNGESLYTRLLASPGTWGGSSPWWVLY